MNARPALTKVVQLLSRSLLLILLASPVFSAQIGIAQLDGFLHDANGLIAQFDAGSPNFSSTLDANNIGTFGWTYENTGNTTLTNVRFFVFLDADIDRSINTAFNEYGEVIAQSLPPNAAANALVWSSFQIDEPGFVSGTIFNNLFAGTLDNTDHVPPGMTNDVSLALGFSLGNVAPGQFFTATFQISPADIGGLRQTDPDSNFAFFFNGDATAPANGPNGTGQPPISGVPEPGTALLLLAPFACFVTMRTRELRRHFSGAFLIILRLGRKRTNTTFLLTSLAIAVMFPAVGLAVTIKYSDFSSTAGLTLNGNAAIASTSDGNVLRIVPATGFASGSVFSSAQINAGALSTYFQFRFTQPSGLGGGADGIVFVVQPVSASLGGAGGGEGYSGITPSIGVEFDIFQNGWDTNNSHVAVLKNGDVTVHLTQYDTPSPMLDGNIRHVWIDYDGSTLEMRMNTSNSRPATANLRYTINIPQLIGQSNAFVGFTAGTGLGMANHDLLTWQYNSTFAPIGLSSPLITNLTTRFKDTSIDIVWSPPATLPASSRVASYNLYRRTDTQPFGLIKAGLTTTNYTDVGLTDGTTYYYVVRWVDNGGFESGNSTEMSATPTSAANRAAHNTPPTILSNPVILATAGSPYTYPVKASDPDPGDVLTYSLPTALSGMTISSSTGVISWTPAPTQVGSLTAKVRVQDRNGNFASQQYQVVVQGVPPTAPPVISSIPLLTATVGQVYSYQVLATDPNSGAILIYSLPTFPAGMTIDRNGGLIQWVPTAAQTGVPNVRVNVLDQFGLSATQPFSINVVPAPILAPTITSTPVTTAVATLPYTYQVTATSTNPGALTYSLLSSPSGMTISSTTGLIQWSPTTAQQGAQNVTVKVQDGIGQSATQLFTIQVTAPILPPSVTITSPAPNSTVTEVTNIVGSISDPSGTTGGQLAWKLGILKPGATNYQTIAMGNATVTNGTIAQIDPTILPNNTYAVRLTVTKGPFVLNTDFTVSVAGNLKLGNFTTQFTDLSIPVAGIPITISRRYDSLDTSTGEFGAGWRLALPGQVTDSAGGNAYTGLTRIYVTRPDGKRVGFTFSPTFSGTFLPVWFPGFTPDPGVTDSLAVANDALFNSGGSFFDVDGPFNPTLFTLTTKQGVKYDIDKNAGLQKITDTNGNTLTVTAAGLVSSTGVTLAFQRDTQNRITKITEPGASPGTLQYAYDTAGNLASFTDQNGNKTVYSYENATFPNYLTKIQDPLGRPLIRNVYDASGRIIAQCNANGNPTTLAGCATFNPNAVGKLQTVINARGFRTDLILDANGNVLTERHWLDNSTFLDTVRTYDANNNLLSQTDPAGNKSAYTYDAARNKLTETDPLGHSTKYTYNACNQVLTTTDAAGNVTTNTYDGNCNLLTVKDALGAVTAYKYNDQGQQSDFIDAVGSHWVWAYDASGYLSSLTDPFGKATTFAFNSTGDLLTRIDRNARRIDFQYDSAHHMTKETWNTTPARVTTYGYNTAGQLTGASDPDSALAITYDNVGQLASVDNNGTPGVPRVLMSYTYDANANVTAVNDSLGGITGYVYDALDRLSRVTQSGAGVNPKRVDYQYDSASFLTKLSRFSDLAGMQPVANTLFESDCNGCPGRITAIRHRKAVDNSVIHDLTFSRDVLGNITASSDAEGTHSYGYDQVRRLLTANHGNPALQPNEFYTYDAVGNRLVSHISSSYAYSYMAGTGNRLTQDQQFTYEYDGEGNLVRKTDRTSGVFTVYAYDYRNRMNSLVQNTSGGVQTATARYKYDMLNRRISANEEEQTLTFAYDGLNPALKMAEVGTIVSRRMYGRSLDSIIADEARGQTRWFLTDQAGTTRDLVGAPATVVDHYDYDSFGRILSQTNPATIDDLIFGGRELDMRTGLEYFRARFYDPSRGRFLSEDPFLPFGYAYGANNPLSFTDPLGQSELAEYGVQVNKALGEVACITELYVAANNYILKYVGLPPNNITYIGIGYDTLGLAFGIFDIKGLAFGAVLGSIIHNGTGLPEDFSSAAAACVAQRFAP